MKFGKFWENILGYLAFSLWILYLFPQDIFHTCCLTRIAATAYAWLKCEREEDELCYQVLQAGGILGRDGTLFGASSRYVRLSLIKSQDDFDQLLQHLNKLVLQEAGSTKADL